MSFLQYLQTNIKTGKKSTVGAVLFLILAAIVAAIPYYFQLKGNPLGEALMNYNIDLSLALIFLSGVLGGFIGNAKLKDVKSINAE